MKHLFAAWPQFEPLIKERLVVLFLDYDGTLTPIVEHPRLAKLSSQGKKLLRQTAHTEGVRTAIVSGRSLADLEALVGVPGLMYVGNHGLEFEGPAMHFTHPEALEAKELIQKIKGRLKEALRPFRGILVEDKVFTLSVHYRRLAQDNAEKAQAVFSKILAPYLAKSQVVLTEGKKVWEVRPAIRWNKGTMVLWLYGRMLAHYSQNLFAVYVGDDRTDEDAFSALRRVGIGVKVTPLEDASSHAAYFLRSPGEVFEFLNRLKTLKGSHAKSRTPARV